MTLDLKDISGLLHEYFVQNGSLSLPAIGVFRLIRVSAQVDIANRRILPPSYTVRFDNRGEAPSKELFGYLSMRTGVDDLEAVRLLNHFAFDMKDRLQRGEEIEWSGFGRLLPDKGSGFGFEPDRMTFDFTSEVRAHRIIHKDAEHIITVGEDKKTNVEMKEILSEIGKKPALISRFWFRALLVLLTALFIIASRVLLTPSSVMPDRADTLQPVEPAPVYSIQKQP